MARILTAQFPDRRSAESALADLRARGFDLRNARLVPEEHVEGAPPPAKRAGRSLSAALMGALIGAVVGALSAWIASSLLNSVTSTTTAGMIVTAIVGGTIGWFLGGLAGSGQPIEEGEYRQERVELGQMQLRFEPGDRRAEARDILQRFAARDMRETNDMQSNDGAGTDDSVRALN